VRLGLQQPRVNLGVFQPVHGPKPVVKRVGRELLVLEHLDQLLVELRLGLHNERVARARRGARVGMNGGAQARAPKMQPAGADAWNLVID
jgi:hypothetical protein